MRKIWRSVCLVAVIFIFNAISTAAEADDDIFKGPVDARLDALAKIQPGLGTVMVEYGNRFVDVFFAAKGGNWGLAQYQLKEMREIQEVGEVTRPQKAPLLTSFEEGYLEPLEKAILAQEWSKFNGLYRDAIDGCNSCHVGTDHGFIRFKLPARPTENYIDFTLKSAPSSSNREK